MVKRILGAVVVVAGLVGLLAYSKARPQPLVVSGFVEADEIRLGSRVGGRVKVVHVQEGDRIEVGTLLLELEEFDLNARRSEAEANLAAQQADLERLQRGYRDEEIGQALAHMERLQADLTRLRRGPRDEEIEVGRARLDLANAQWKRAKQTYERNVQLMTRSSDAVSRDEMDRVTEELSVSESNKVVSEQELQLLEKGAREEDLLAAEKEFEQARQAWLLLKNGYRPEDIAQAEAAVAAARAALDIIKAQLQELSVISPVSGVVEASDLNQGDLVGPNAPVLSVMDTSRLWIRAYVPEDKLDIALGKSVRVNVDSFSGEQFNGEVTFISRQAEFTPNNVQTPEDRANLVFRIKVTLATGADRLRPGMMADVLLED